MTLTVHGTIGTYEDVFTFDGETHHEVARLYEVTIDQEWVYDRDQFVGYEPVLDLRIDCRWKPVSDFVDGEDTFYPTPVLEEFET